MRPPGEPWKGIRVGSCQKLPPTWKDFKNYLKHKRKEMSIEDLVIRLRIEEDNKGSERKMAHNPNEAKANFVEHGQGSKFKKGNNERKGTKLGPKGGVFKKQKFIGKCFKLKVTNLLIADFRRETNSRKPMWLTTSPRMCLKLTSLQ